MLPVFDVGRPIQWVKDIAINATKWIALKLLLLSLITVVLPLSIYAGWKLISKQIMQFVMSSSGDLGNMSALVQFTGLAAWLGDKFRMQECFIILSTALMYKFILSFFRK